MTRLELGHTSHTATGSFAHRQALCYASQGPVKIEHTSCQLPPSTQPRCSRDIGRREKVMIDALPPDVHSRWLSTFVPHLVGYFWLTGHDTWSTSDTDSESLGFHMQECWNAIFVKGVLIISAWDPIHKRSAPCHRPNVPNLRSSI